jgi:hypothetical protein
MKRSIICCILICFDANINFFFRRFYEIESNQMTANLFFYMGLIGLTLFEYFDIVSFIIKPPEGGLH